MPIICGDTESAGFSKTFICGAICEENLKTTSFKTKQEMVKWVYDYAEKERKKGHNTYLYFHNLEFDFYRLFDIMDKKLNIISKSNPFMANYGKPKAYLYFLDSMLLYRCSLKEIGEIIGEPKTELNENIKKVLFNEKTTRNKIKPEDLKTIEEYCEQDTKVLMKGIQYIKNNLKKEDMNPRRLMTAGQIAYNAFEKTLRQPKYEYNLMEIPLSNNGWNNMPKRIILTNYGQEIEPACRGGRIQALNTEENIENCWEIDYNSLYPHASTLIPFPALKTERKWIEPLQNFNEKQVTEYIGISKCLIKLKKQNIGFMPIRWKDNQMFPEHNIELIGTWTHLELKQLLEEGHRIKAIEYSIVYGEYPESPLTEHMTNLYEKRKKSEFDSYFYKMLMNQLTGKFKQKNDIQEYKIGERGELPELEKQGFTPTISDGYNFIYVKDIKTVPARSYCPILYAYITAKARQIIHESMTRIPKQDIIYIGTDSIITKGNYTDKFVIGTEIGEWKIQKQNEKVSVTSKQNYKIGDTIKASGISKTYLTPEMYDTGEIDYKVMQTISNAGDVKDLGTFKPQKADFTEKKAWDKQINEILKDTTRITDQNESNNWFKEKGYI